MTCPTYVYEECACGSERFTIKHTVTLENSRYKGLYEVRCCNCSKLRFILGEGAINGGRCNSQNGNHPAGVSE